MTEKEILARVIFDHYRRTDGLDVVAEETADAVLAAGFTLAREPEWEYGSLGGVRRVRRTAAIQAGRWEPVEEATA